MIANKITTSEINLDLSFQSFVDKKSANYFLLINQESWQEKLKSWLKYIRLNTQYLCPNLVRRCNYFSVGLQFTDDQTICKINETWLNKAEPTDVLSFPVIDESSLVS